jgi:glucokinase
MPYALGIDLGGTKILAGVIDLRSGKVMSLAKKRTRVELGADEMVARILGVAREALAAANLPSGESVRSVGIGAAGQVDRARGILLRAPNLATDVRDLPLAERINHALDLPATLCNDVEAAAAGEAHFGSGRGHSDFLCVFVGTGIGAAIIQGGVPYRGASNTAGEIGHTVIDHGGRLCGCGGRGHLEAYASRSAIVRVLLAEMGRGRDTVLRTLVPDAIDDAGAPGGTAIRSRAISQAVAAGDELTIDIVTEGARYLASGLASVVTFYNPPRVILGGGLVMAVDLFFETAVRYTRQYAHPIPAATVELVRSGLGDDAGIVGAAALSRS